MLDYYEILSVDFSATGVEIRAAYRRLVFENHPDRNSANGNSEAILKEINEAYRVLSDVAMRAEYDAVMFGQVRTHAAPTQFALANSEFPIINFLKTAVIESAWLFIPLSGAWAVVFLEEVFFPIFPYSMVLLSILSGALIAGGLTTGIGKKAGLARPEAGAIGILVGGLVGILFFSPDSDFYSFLLIAKLCFGSGVAGIISGVLGSWLGCRFYESGSAPGMTASALTAALTGALLGAAFALILGHQLSEDALFAIASVDLPRNFELTLIALGAISGAGGGALLGMALGSGRFSFRR